MASEQSVLMGEEVKFNDSLSHHRNFFFVYLSTAGAVGGYGPNGLNGGLNRFGMEQQYPGGYQQPYQQPGGYY